MLNLLRRILELEGEEKRKRKKKDMKTEYNVYRSRTSVLSIVLRKKESLLKRESFQVSLFRCCS